MRVNISYSDKAIDKDIFYDTIVKVIKRIETNKTDKGTDTDGNKTNTSN